MKQIPPAIGPETEPTFDTFVPGANAPALEHLRSLVLPAAPVYLWGAPGSGKTHLLQALTSRVRAAGARAGWFSPQDPPPWVLLPEWSVVVIDDCDRLDPLAQQAAFTMFVEAASHGVQVVAAGRLPPVDLPLRDDLRTRLGWGHVFAMQCLSESETRAALRREADRRGIFLSDDVMGYLMTRFARDLKHLMQLLDRLDEFALATSRQVTVPLLKRMLAEEAAPGGGDA